VNVYHAKSVVLDIANNYGWSSAALRSVDFYRNGVLIPIAEGDIAYAYTTSDRSPRYRPENAFITALPKTGTHEDTEFWTMGVASNIRLFCVFATPIEFDEMVINNSHDGNGYVDAGAKDIKISITAQVMDASGFGSTIPGGVLIHDGTLNKHVVGDVEDPQAPTLLAYVPNVSTPVFLLPLTLSAAPNENEYATPFIMTALMVAAVQDNDAWLAFIRSQGSFAQKLFFCTITGAANGLPDITVPISSFQSRRRSGTPSYLQAVVAGVGCYEGITLRPDGDILISMAYRINGVTMFQEVIARANMGSIDFYGGGKSQSVTLSGAKQTTYSSGKTVALSNVVQSSFVSGKWRARMAVPDLYLNPGDTVIVDGGTFTADLITTTVSISGGGRVACSVEVSES